MRNSPRLMRFPVLRNSLTLGAFALLAALPLAVVNLATAERIAQQRAAAERRLVHEVFPAALHDNDLLAEVIMLADEAPFASLELLGLREPRPAYVARRNHVFSGVVLPLAAPDGYSGEILMLAGIAGNGAITGVRVLEHGETPGLGDKIELTVSDWMLDFNGRSLEDPPTSRWRVVRDGGDFVQFTGATITPRAVVNALRRALRFFEENRELLADGVSNEEG